MHLKVTDMRHWPKGCVVWSRHTEQLSDHGQPVPLPPFVPALLGAHSSAGTTTRFTSPLIIPQSEFRFSGQDRVEFPPGRAFWKGKHKSYVSYSSSRWEHGACCNGFEPFSILSCRFLLPKSYYNKIPQLTGKALSFSVQVLQLWLSALLSLSVTPGTS